MKAPRRRMGLGTTVLALFIAAPALAQENIDEGKSPAQLYAQNCAICHKSPHGLSRAGGGVLGVQNFLREHYTASQESAAAIAGYLATIDRGAPPRERARLTKRTPKNEKAKAREEKSNKADEAKSETKPAEKKPEEAKLPPSKPPEVKADAKPEAKSESKPAESKAPESKPGEADAKTGGAKASSDVKPEKKAD